MSSMEEVIQSSNPPAAKRQRLPAHRFEGGIESQEEHEVRQALANSVQVQSRDIKLEIIPFGPVFHPTIEEFNQDPLVYLETIRPIAEKYGIAKIVPPEGWNPPFTLNAECDKKFQTKDQSIHRLQEGISFGDGSDYTVKEYQKMCTNWSRKWKAEHYSKSSPSASRTPLESAAHVQVAPPPLQQSVQERKFTPENIERDYWDIVESQSQSIDVDYGNDVDTDTFGSGFPLSERGRSVNSSNFLSKSSSDGDLPEPEFGTEEYYKETFWNLNNIPNSKRSVLRHLKIGINGINVPWLYFGCLFSTFCWHNEDNYMYSINYHHKGAPKQWYGVPGTKKDADGVEQVFKNFLSVKIRDVPDLLHHITTSFSPRLLHNEGVRVCKILQKEGEFIVTFPRAFHGGFSLGPNCGEAVNFALQDWIPHAVDANERYRSFGRPSVFSHDRLVYTMAHHHKDLRTKDISKALAGELRRLMQEELLLRKKLLIAGVRDVSSDVELPPNRLDQLDDESADYDDKRMCHSCKHICFFSAVCCECSDQKVSCLRHSHYMCRCHISRKYLLIWTSEEEMKEAVANVERRGKELEEVELSSHSARPEPCYAPLVDASGTARDRAEYKEIEVSVDPICSGVEVDVPQLALSDVSVCSSEMEKSMPQSATIGSVISDGVLAPITLPETAPVSSIVPLPVPNTMESSKSHATTNLTVE